MMNEMTMTFKTMPLKKLPRLSPLRRSPLLFAAMLLILAAGSLAGCDPFEPEPYREYVVVEAWLKAGQPLPPVRLSTTMPVDQKYSFEEAAVAGAEVRVHLLDPSGESEAAYAYEMERPGIYRPAPGALHEVIPGRTYHLEVELSDGRQVRARTTVPQPFAVSANRESIIYQENLLGGDEDVDDENKQLILTIHPLSESTQQRIFIFNAIADSPTYENLTPFYKDVIDSDDEIDINEFANNSSGLTPDDMFTTEPDGTLDLRYPWIGVAFYGGQTIVANSIDSNTNDFVRSQSVQLGGSTLSPGEIPNAIYHVEGGIGVFGSMVSDSVYVRIERPDFSGF